MANKYEKIWNEIYNNTGFPCCVEQQLQMLPYIFICHAQFSVSGVYQQNWVQLHEAVVTLRARNYPGGVMPTALVAAAITCS